MGTFPEDVQALAENLYGLCERHGIENIYMRCGSPEPTRERSMLISIEHQYGSIPIGVDSNINAPQDLPKIASRVEAGIKAVTIEIEEKVSEYRLASEVIQRLVPNPLDQIVDAIKNDTSQQ